MRPKPYDMKNVTDLRRWFREMKGYLKVANEGRGFITDGTDIDGREYAMQGFLELEAILTANALPNSRLDIWFKSR